MLSCLTVVAIDYGLDNVSIVNCCNRNTLRVIVKYAAFGFFVPGYDISDSDVNGFFGYRYFNFCFHVFTLSLLGAFLLFARPL
jgi:hypothetical protein